MFVKKQYPIFFLFGIMDNSNCYYLIIVESRIPSVPERQHMFGVPGYGPSSVHGVDTDLLRDKSTNTSAGDLFPSVPLLMHC